MRRRSRVCRVPGGELANHFVKQFKLEGVTVAKTELRRDRFDPNNKTVYLGPENYDKKSLTAIAVAAHEVGHAIQYQRREQLILLRSRLYPILLILNIQYSLCKKQCLKSMPGEAGAKRRIGRINRIG